MKLELQSQRVVRIVLDFDLAIQFADGASLAFSEFRVGDELIDEDNQFDGLRATATLVGCTCVAADVSAGGELRVEFDDGTVLTAEPRPEVESWEFTAVDGSMTICLGGGEIDECPPPADRRPNHSPIPGPPSVGAKVVRIAVGQGAVVEFSDRTTFDAEVWLDEAYLVLRESVVAATDSRVRLSSGVDLALTR